MLVSGAGALFLVSGFQWLGFVHRAAWNASYLVMAALVVIGIITTLVAREPEKSVAAEHTHAHGWSNALRRLAFRKSPSLIAINRDRSCGIQITNQSRNSPRRNLHAE